MTNPRKRRGQLIPYSRERDACVYCGLPASERDHFPVPECAGGKDTVPICRGCHDAKDRFSFDTWDPSTVFEAWNQCGPLGKVLMAKIIAGWYRSRPRIACPHGCGAMNIPGAPRCLGCKEKL